MRFSALKDADGLRLVAEIEGGLKSLNALTELRPGGLYQASAYLAY